ncbi:MAG: M48 family metallopeptidase [Bacteroidales bacterium]
MKQFDLPLVKPRGGQDVEVLAIGRRMVTIAFLRNPRARHYHLRMTGEASVRVTVPRSGTRTEAREFVRAQREWIDGQRYAAARSRAAIRVAGDVCALVVDEGAGRDIVMFGHERVALRQGESPRDGACRALRERASRELPPRLLELAQRLGLPVARVTIRNQQTRWGSCSPGGAISLNWRLVQMPDAVRDYVLIHELMHVKINGHGQRFWQAVERSCPAHREARRWLREHERELL